MTLHKQWPAPFATLSLVSLSSLSTLALLIVCLVLPFPSAPAAAPVHEWSQRFGDANPDHSRGIALDASGNVIVTGFFKGTVDFGGGNLVGTGLSDAYLAKYDANGLHQWSLRFGGPAHTQFYALALDASDNIIVVGRFQNTVDFGGGNLVSAGGMDIVVAKYDENGAHLWSKRFGAADWDECYAVAIDAVDNVIVTGAFRGTVDFGGGGLVSAGSDDIFVAKFDASGVHQWSQRFGSAVGTQESGYGVAIDASNDVIVTGRFEGVVDFGGGDITSGGGLDIFIAKYDANGVHQWSKGFGTASSQELGAAVVVDAADGVIFTGVFNNTVDFGGGPLTSAGENDGFIVKYDANGVHQWSRRFGDSIVHGYDSSQALAVDALDNVIATGSFSGTVNFGGGDLIASGNGDMFVAKYDAGGAHVWSERRGGTGLEQAVGVAVGAAGATFTTGTFSGTANFGGGNLVSAGSNDIFVAKHSDRHFVIAYPDGGGVDPGNRSALVNNWVTVRVTATDGLGSPITTFVGTVSLSTKGESGAAEIDWALSSGNGVFVDGGLGDNGATYAFDPADNGVVDLQVRDDSQDFVDPEVVEMGVATVTDDDTEEYITFTQANNILEGPADVNNIVFGAGLAAYSTSTPTPTFLTLLAYVRGATGGFLVDPTVTVVPYKNTSLLGVTPPPNFKMMYSAQALEAPHPFCNGYDTTIPGYPPIPLPSIVVIAQSFDDAVLSEVEEGNIQLHHWNGASWDIIPATVNTAANSIVAVVTNLSQLSPFFITQPNDENMHAADIEIEPDSLNIVVDYGWVYGYVELPGLDLNDIDLATVTLNPTEIDVPEEMVGVAVADPGHLVIGDHDNDANPDAELRFPRGTVVSMLTGGSPSEGFTIRGFMNDGFTYFRGDATIVTVDEVPTAVPDTKWTFALRQNYPNPFNPTTTIAYSILSSEDVRLSIFDVNGALVATLVNERQEANSYRVLWNGRDAQGGPVASGIYFCRLTAGNFLATRKLVLLK